MEASRWVEGRIVKDISLSSQFAGLFRRCQCVGVCVCIPTMSVLSARHAYRSHVKRSNLAICYPPHSKKKKAPTALTSTHILTLMHLYHSWGRCYGQEVKVPGAQNVAKHQKEGKKESDNWMANPR